MGKIGNRHIIHCEVRHSHSSDTATLIIGKDEENIYSNTCNGKS